MECALAHTIPLSSFFGTGESATQLVGRQIRRDCREVSACPVIASFRTGSDLYGGGHSLSERTWGQQCIMRRRISRIQHDARTAGNFGAITNVR